MQILKMYPSLRHHDSLYDIHTGVGSIVPGVIIVRPLVLEKLKRTYVHTYTRRGRIALKS